MHRTALYLLAALVAVSCFGCLRYVPSRTEIERKSGNRSSVPEKAAQLGGPEYFKAFEQKLAERERRLMDERRFLLSPEAQQTYRIGRGDLLDVEVFGLGDLSATAEVSAEGTVQLPLAGLVDVGGKTLSEVRAELTAGYAKYVKAPRVRVSIKEYHAHTVSVIGAVTKPGLYSLTREGQTLTELISLAGGRTDKAGMRIILIPAFTPPPLPAAGEAAAGEEMDNGAAPAPVAAAPAGRKAPAHGVEFDYDDLMGTIDERPLIIPLASGDTIIVPEMGNFKVDGEVIKAGSFPLTPHTSALGAIAAAGGLTYSANVNQVEVIRDFGSGKKASLVVDLEQVALNGAQDIPLRDGDVVRVPSDPGRFRTRQLVEAINGIFRGGVSGSVRYQ
jgi:polysaccharide export outer membrane protein